MSWPPELPGALPAVRVATPLGGGDVAEAWRATLADGRQVVVKATPYDAELEAEGLVALGEAGGPVPRVLAASHDVLVIEHVSGQADWVALATGLAAVHATRGPAFGWHRDNVIGPLPQVNAWTDTHGRFVVEHRIRPHLEVLPGPVARRLAAACEDLLPGVLDEHAPSPSLVHGDLWTGNVVDGRWLIDPAVHHADRETDLAALHLFGGPPEVFTRTYAQVAPLPDGWRRRRPLLQLHLLLVHVRLFGAAYVPSIVGALDAAGVP